MSNFVTTDGTLFRLRSGRHPFQGVNCYFLAYCSDESRRAAMADASAMGAEVIRCWAFLAIDHFVPGRVAFQYFREGEIVINDGPDGLQRLDALIQAADEMGIALILPLVNYWDALGGMSRYVNWLSPGSNAAAAEVTEFYRSRTIRQAYRNWVSAILTRRNTLTGRLYSEEPAILAWELTNEARCPIEGGRELLLDWVGEMAAFVKGLDTNHLLGLGDEGFFFQKGRGHLYDGSHGVDWEANLALPSIDFGSYHFYPQDWGYAGNLDFAKGWIRDHAAVAERLNKPVLLEEFGLKLDTRQVKTTLARDAWFRKWQSALDETSTAGSLLWMLGHRAPDTSGYVDDYVIYGPNQSVLWPAAVTDSF